MAAKFRRNHIARKGGSGFLRIIIFAMILVLSLWYLAKQIGNLDLDNKFQESDRILTDSTMMMSLKLVTPVDVEIIDHGYYTLGYNEAHEQAEWVSYILTAELLKAPNVPRTDWFSEDPDVKTGSAHHRDYIRSGYTRGHLIPAADVAFSDASMKSSFYMSNISPQLASFNGGVWRELEETVRQWAYRYDTLYIVTGPVLSVEPVEWIGKTSSVAVPAFFYKAILNKDAQAVAFILPHRLSTEPIREFAVTIDSLEEFTGLEIYDDILPDSIEVRVEKEMDLSLWPADPSKYSKRINKWNKR